MSIVQGFVVPVLPGQIDRLTSWAARHGGRSREVADALRARGVDVQLLMLDRSTAHGSVVVVIRAAEPKTALLQFLQSSRGVDDDARQVFDQALAVDQMRTLEVLAEVFPPEAPATAGSPP